MNNRYKRLDVLIINAIASRKDVYTDENVVSEAKRISNAPGKVYLNLIDERIIALRGRNEIRYFTETIAPGGKAGWYITQEVKAT